MEYLARPAMRDDASIVPYKLFAAFVAIGKVSPRRDEGIAPYSRVVYVIDFMMAYAVMRRNGQDRSLQFGFMFVTNFKMLYKERF